jgi:hypothetical protein
MRVEAPPKRSLGAARFFAGGRPHEKIFRLP